MNTTQYYFDNHVNFQLADEFMCTLKCNHDMYYDDLKKFFYAIFKEVMDERQQLNPFIRMSKSGYFEIIVPDSYTYADDLNRFCLFHGFNDYDGYDCKIWCAP